MSLLDVQLRCVRLGARSVLKDINFQCDQGQHTAILGPNGAGKSTLIRAMAGLLPYDGQVFIAGKPLDQLERRIRAQRIAYVPQSSSLNADLSVSQVVMQGRYCHQNAWGTVTSNDRRAVHEALEMTDALHLRERSYLRLSGGEQKRVLLARALATDAEVILLDEPAAALDIAHVLSLFERLHHLAERDKCLVTVLHQLPDAERFCDQIVLLDQGQLCYCGTGALPLALVKQVYGVRVEANAAPRYQLWESGN